MVNFKAYAIGAAGVATSAFGFVAWTSYLFAGTGAAKLICFSLIILGAIIAFIGGLHVDNNAEAPAEAPAEAEVSVSFFFKVLGGALSGFGFYAWVSFLFAGTGFAMGICLGIVLLGAGIAAYAKELEAFVRRQAA